MVSYYDNFVFDVSRDNTQDVPNRHDFVVDYIDCSVTKRATRTLIGHTIINQGDHPVQSTPLDFLQEELSVGPRDGETGDSGNVGAIRASAVLVRRIAWSRRIPISISQDVSVQ